MHVLTLVSRTCKHTGPNAWITRPQASARKAPHGARRAVRTQEREGNSNRTCSTTPTVPQARKMDKRRAGASDLQRRMVRGSLSRQHAPGEARRKLIALNECVEGVDAAHAPLAEVAVDVLVVQAAEDGLHKRPRLAPHGDGAIGAKTTRRHVVSCLARASTGGSGRAQERRGDVCFHTRARAPLEDTHPRTCSTQGVTVVDGASRARQLARLRTVRRESWPGRGSRRTRQSARLAKMTAAASDRALRTRTVVVPLESALFTADCHRFASCSRSEGRLHPPLPFSMSPPRWVRLREDNRA